MHQLLRMGRGAVIELNTNQDDPVTILANNLPVAKGEIIIEGDRITVSIIEILQGVGQVQH
jgi:flagellar motor switch protein FliN/FliY